jgi:hypothetical protein
MTRPTSSNHQPERAEPPMTAAEKKLVRKHRKLAVHHRKMAALWRKRAIAKFGKAAVEADHRFDLK